MIDQIKKSLWSQFGASIDMLSNAIDMCPEEHWNTESRFWYNAYHCLFFLDYYLTMNPKEFIPPPPFDESEFEGRMPNRVYTKAELMEYLRFCKEKCRTLLESLTEETVLARWVNQSKTMDYSRLEILLYNMRHVQHHAAQLNFILRKTIDEAPKWVSRANRI